ncbi:MAG: class I SAM-dependent methyltransferase [Actinobacteria bacterium]|nr:class I SAM-dependent methyltransferase [Actinomycetota bacterium]
MSESATALDHEGEVRESGLVEHLERRAAEFWDTVKGETERGHRYNTGRITGRDGYDEGFRLYRLLREMKPRVAVETGVCNGVSTAFLLLALERNGDGELHSIDLPEIAGEQYEPGTFWDGKGGAVIPPGRDPGWMIPADLRGRWSLVLGRSQDELRPLLEGTGEIDFFMHDSEHSYDCMSFEFDTAWEALRDGGALIADDVNLNPAWDEFTTRVGRRSQPLGSKLALIVK